MQLGSTPATAVATIRASGLHPPSVVPSFRRITSRAAAPSLIPLELPAVTVPPPSGRNAGLSCASCSADALGRGYSSLAKRSEEHTSELQSLAYLVCRLLLEKKKT